MNWSKAKSILIVAFCLTNLFLLFIMININNADKDTVSDDYKRMALELLNKHNVNMDIDLPNADINIPEITVKYEIYNPNEERYAGFEIPSHNKSLSYTTQSDIVLYEDLDQEKAEKAALEFINQNGFNNNDIKHWSTTLDDDLYIVEYKQQYEDITLDDGFMVVFVDDTGVMEFNRRWLSIESTETNTQTIIHPYKVLLLAMDKLPKDGGNITEMLLTYKLDIDQAIDTEWYNIDHGTLSPYWKIRFDTGEFIDIKAYQ